MRDAQVIRGFEASDQAINTLRNELKALGKEFDKVYLSDLTHRMMWDVLLGALGKKGVLTQAEFDADMKALKESTEAAMEALKKARIEKAEREAGKVTVLSDKPAIPVIK